MKPGRIRRAVAVCLAVLLMAALAAAAAVQTWRLNQARTGLAEADARLAELQSQLEQVQSQLEQLQADDARQEQLRQARSRQLDDLAAFADTLADGDLLGRVRVEGTQVDCSLFWGDAGSQFADGAGAHSLDGCVLPGQNGTVFIGAHTNSFFADLRSAQVGGLIRLETPWGDYSYRITETRVIQETDIDLCRWGATQPSCILYTCYPFGVTYDTDQRYLVYADPVARDDQGALPDDLISLQEQESGG